MQLKDIPPGSWAVRAGGTGTFHLPDGTGWHASCAGDLPSRDGAEQAALAFRSGATWRWAALLKPLDEARVVAEGLTAEDFASGAVLAAAVARLSSARGPAAVGEVVAGAARLPGRCVARALGRGDRAVAHVRGDRTHRWVRAEHEGEASDLDTDRRGSAIESVSGADDAWQILALDVPDDATAEAARAAARLDPVPQSGGIWLAAGGSLALRFGGRHLWLSFGGEVGRTDEPGRTQGDPAAWEIAAALIPHPARGQAPLVELRNRAELDAALLAWPLTAEEVARFGEALDLQRALADERPPPGSRSCAGLVVDPNGQRVGRLFGDLSGSWRRRSSSGRVERDSEDLREGLVLCCVPDEHGSTGENSEALDAAVQRAADPAYLRRIVTRAARAYNATGDAAQARAVLRGDAPPALSSAPREIKAGDEVSTGALDALPPGTVLDTHDGTRCPLLARTEHGWVYAYSANPNYGVNWADGNPRLAHKAAAHGSLAYVGQVPVGCDAAAFLRALADLGYPPSVAAVALAPTPAVAAEVSGWADHATLLAWPDRVALWLPDTAQWCDLSGTARTEGEAPLYAADGRPHAGLCEGQPLLSGLSADEVRQVRLAWPQTLAAAQRVASTLAGLRGPNHKPRGWAILRAASLAGAASPEGRFDWLTESGAPRVVAQWYSPSTWSREAQQRSVLADGLTEAQALAFAQAVCALPNNAARRRAFAAEAARAWCDLGALGAAALRRPQPPERAWMLAGHEPAARTWAIGDGTVHVVAHGTPLEGDRRALLRALADQGYAPAAVALARLGPRPAAVGDEVPKTEAAWRALPPGTLVRLDRPTNPGRADCSLVLVPGDGKLHYRTPEGRVNGSACPWGCSDVVSAEVVALGVGSDPAEVAAAARAPAATLVDAASLPAGTVARQAAPRGLWLRTARGWARLDVAAGCRGWPGDPPPAGLCEVVGTLSEVAQAAALVEASARRRRGESGLEAPPAAAAAADVAARAAHLGGLLRDLACEPWANPPSDPGVSRDDAASAARAWVADKNDPLPRLVDPYGKAAPGFAALTRLGLCVRVVPLGCRLVFAEWRGRPLGLSPLDRAEGPEARLRILELAVAAALDESSADPLCGHCRAASQFAGVNPAAGSRRRLPWLGADIIAGRVLAPGDAPPVCPRLLIDAVAALASEPEEAGAFTYMVPRAAPGTRAWVRNAGPTRLDGPTLIGLVAATTEDLLAAAVERATPVLLRMARLESAALQVVALGPETRGRVL